VTALRALSGSLLSILLLTSFPGGAQSPEPPAAQVASESKLNPVAPAEQKVVRLTAVADDRRTLTAADQSGQTYAVKVRVTDLVERLKGYHAGDVVKVWIASDEGDLLLRNIEHVSGLGSRTERVLALAIALAVLLALVSLFYRGNAKGLLYGLDGRYSKSTFQMAVWFAALFATYCAAVYLRARYSHGLSWGGVNIPENLLLISGLSALSFAGAKGITSSAVGRGLVKSPSAASFPADLLNGDDGRPDFGDFQMLVVTALATFVYLGSAVSFLGQMDLAATVTLPDVDTTILSAFGLGQGAYLAKKALSASAGNPNPLAPPQH
jgi:hypothetical protein